MEFILLPKNAVEFCKRLNLELPIIQAPMAGNVVTPALVREVNRNGALGSLPFGYLSVKEARVAIEKVRENTTKNFAVNLFIPADKVDLSKSNLAAMLIHINQQRKNLNLAELTKIEIPAEPDLRELIELIINESIPIVSFTFGILNIDLMNLLHKNNIFVMGTATTITEAIALEEAGCDAVIAQGYEAGGHRGGGFIAKQEGGLIGTMTLVPQMVDAVKIPVIASGGIMDGRGIIAALSLGASAVQMGTAFLLCTESGASSTQRVKILQSNAEDTCITSAFTGKPLRGLANKYVRDTENLFPSDKIPPYPVQHYLTKELRASANKPENFDYSGYWSGQNTRNGKIISTKWLLKNLELEMKSVLEKFKISLKQF